MSFLKDRFHDLIKKQGLKAGYKPVANLAGENDRINEIKRLKLEDKDVSNDRQLNNVTELACYLTDRPQCTINLLTDKSQLSKNNHGFSIPEQILVKEIPRDISICQYVLEQPRDQLVIENVKENQKTQNFHKMALAPDIQFYAGTPIITSKGFTVGTLCVMDSKPGSLAHSQREGLRLLSDQVSTILEYTAVKPPAGFNESAAQEPSTRDASFYSSASILFTDFVGFTTISEDVDPGELVASLDEFFRYLIRSCQNMICAKSKLLATPIWRLAAFRMVAKAIRKRLSSCARHYTGGFWVEHKAGNFRPTSLGN